MNFTFWFIIFNHTFLSFKPFPHNDTFWQVWERSLLKTMSENIVYKQFLLFPQCFLLYQWQKLSFLLHLIFHLQMLSVWSGGPKCCVGMSWFNDPDNNNNNNNNKKTYENIMRKKRKINAGSLYFYPFLKMFLPHSEKYHWEPSSSVFLIISPEHKVLRVSYCDRPISGVRRSSTISFNIS